MFGILFKLAIGLTLLIGLASWLFSNQQKRAIHRTVKIAAMVFVALSLLRLAWFLF